MRLPFLPLGISDSIREVHTMTEQDYPVTDINEDRELEQPTQEPEGNSFLGVTICTRRQE